MLTEKGLVTRTPLPNDRRQILIALTPQGQAIFDALHPVVRDLNERLLSALTDGERRALDTIISKLEEHVTAWMSDVDLPKADRRHGHQDAD